MVRVPTFPFNSGHPHFRTLPAVPISALLMCTTAHARELWSCAHLVTTDWLTSPYLPNASSPPTRYNLPS